MPDIDMTGPAYPRGPSPGSNGIGTFAIGVSPVGTIPSFDYWDAVFSQHANAPVLTSIIGSFFAAADPTAITDALYDQIWNIQTATGYGLDVWGRIVGVNRVLAVAASGFWGFTEALPGSLPFNTSGTGDLVQGGGIFYSGTGLTTSYALSDQSYRLLILAKAAQNITNSSIPAINKILQSLFPGRGNCYVTEGAMTMTYHFTFSLSPVELSIVGSSGVLPKPTGVAVSIVTP